MKMKEERETDNKTEDANDPKLKEDIIEINDDNKEVIDKVLETEISKVESTLVKETFKKINEDPVDEEKSTVALTPKEVSKDMASDLADTKESGFTEDRKVDETVTNLKVDDEAASENKQDEKAKGESDGKSETK